MDVGWLEPKAQRAHLRPTHTYASLVCMQAGHTPALHSPPAAAVPSGQAEQVVEPMMLLNCPAGQGWASSWPPAQV